MESLYESHNFSPSNKLLVFAYEKFLHKTEKAFKLLMYGDEHWLPRKHTILISRHKYVTIPVWIAGKHDFIKVHSIKASNAGNESAAGQLRTPAIFEWERLVPPCTINFDPKTGGK